MQAHFEAVEADFQSYYRLDLRQVLWGPDPYGVRRIHALVTGLPPDGAMIRDMAYDGQEWSVTDELLAALLEEVDYGNRLYYSAHMKKGAQQPKPVEIKRPGRQPELPEGPRPQTPTYELWRVLGPENVVFEGSEN